MAFTAFMILSTVKEANNITGKRRSSFHPEKNVRFSIYMKLIMNFFQISSLISDIDLKWPDYAGVFIIFQSAFGSTLSQLLSLDCVVIGKIRIKRKIK